MDAWLLYKVVPFKIYQVLGLFAQFYTEKVDSGPTSRGNIESPLANLGWVTTSNLLDVAKQPRAVDLHLIG